MAVRMLRHVAPAGAPINTGDLARWAGSALSSRNAGEVLTGAIRERFGVRHSFLTSTGRAGLTVLLRALRTLAPAGRDELILPSYTCYSVAASAVKAGLRVRLVDIRPDTLDYDLDRLRSTDCTRVVAILATNLYGLPNDLPALSEIATRNGVFLIDDAAQSMGASVGGRHSGTWGDAGLFSLDKGKNVSAIDGGIVVTGSDEIAAAIGREMARLPAPGRLDGGVGVVKALAYAVLLRPSLYWIPNGIPQLELGKTVFTLDFPLERASPALVALAGTMVRHLDEFTRARVANAAVLLAGLKGVPAAEPLAPSAASVPVYLRMPVLCADAGARDRALAALTAAGIGASASYPRSLADVDELRSWRRDGLSATTGGADAARRILTLPTHPLVSGADLQRTLTVLRATLGTRPVS